MTTTRTRIQALLDELGPLARREITQALQEPGAQIVRCLKRRAEDLEKLEDLVDHYHNPNFGRF